MPNHFFNFKQFTVQQEHCAMKVCTDACVLGAFTAEHFSKGQAEPFKMLDIGSGTGLLSLMLAQKLSGTIQAIEMNGEAARQARENFESSPWAENLELVQGDIQSFDAPWQYDLIISNPPFFEADLRSSNAPKNEAKHDTGLTLQELVEVLNKHLSPLGSATILLPYHRTNYFKDLCKQASLFVSEVLLLHQSPAHTAFRSIVLLSKVETPYTENSLIIHDEQRQYGSAFTALLQEYYLKL